MTGTLEIALAIAGGLAACVVALAGAWAHTVLSSLHRIESQAETMTRELAGFRGRAETRLGEHHRRLTVLEGERTG